MYALSFSFLNKCVAEEGRIERCGRTKSGDPRVSILVRFRPIEIRGSIPKFNARLRFEFLSRLIGTSAFPHLEITHSLFATTNKQEPPLLTRLPTFSAFSPNQNFSSTHHSQNSTLDFLNFHPYSSILTYYLNPLHQSSTMPPKTAAPKAKAASDHASYQGMIALLFPQQRRVTSAYISSGSHDFSADSHSFGY